MRYSRLLPLVVLILLLAANLVLAHGVDSAVATGPAVTVTFSYDNGSPVSFKDCEVFDPDVKDPFQVGQTDRLGRVVFRPDRSGRWQVRVWTEDGHGSTAQIEVTDNLLVVEALAGRTGKLYKLITGAAVLFGVFGIVALLGRRK